MPDKETPISPQLLSPYEQAALVAPPYFPPNHPDMIGTPGIELTPEHCGEIVNAVTGVIRGALACLPR